jgi:hypothetical protein
MRPFCHDLYPPSLRLHTRWSAVAVVRQVRLLTLDRSHLPSLPGPSAASPSPQNSMRYTTVRSGKHDGYGVFW